MIYPLACIAILASQLSTGVPVDSIKSRQSNPVAPRGGVMMVQLFCQDQGNNWPSTLDVAFADGRVETGVVGWIEKNTNNVGWTNNPSKIRPIMFEDSTLNIDPKDAITGPVLFIELPLRGDGLIRFGGDVIDPRWTDLPISLPNLNITPIDSGSFLSTKKTDDVPEWNPFEYWRWTLLASRRGVMPPKPPANTDIEKLASLQGAHLWRIGFYRLERSSRSVAATCRDLLTNVVTDDAHTYACWVVNPSSLHQLLSILLDVDSNSRQLANRALQWAEDQQPHIHWLDQAYGERVTISIANPTLKSTVAIMQWESENDVPIAIDIPSLETVRCEVERAPIFDSSIFGPTTIQSQSEWLSIMLGGHTTTLPIVPAEAIAQPPSVLLQTLHPLWTLRSIQSGRPNRVNPSLETSVQIRKLLGSWELFVQCSGNNSPTPFPEKIISPADVRGIEAITILHPNSQAIVCISPTGDIAGISIPNNIEVHTASSETGWIARIVIPEVWIDDERFSFSVVRTHGDSTQVETGPLPCVPWSIKPSPIHIDLSTWDNVGKFPISLPIQ